MCQIIKFPSARTEHFQPAFFVGQRFYAKFAHLNKNNTITEYREECERIGGWYYSLCEVQKVLTVSPSEYTETSNNLLRDSGDIAGGGTNSDSTFTPFDGIHFSTPEQRQDWLAKSYRLVTVITSPGCEPFAVDAQGFRYCRYVALDFVDELPQAERPGDLAGCWLYNTTQDAETAIIYKAESTRAGSFNGNGFNFSDNKRLYLAVVDADRNITSLTQTFADDIGKPNSYWRFAYSPSHIDQLTLSEVAELAQKASTFWEEKKAQRIQKETERAQHRVEFEKAIAERKPEGAKAMVVAELYQDESDLQSDYHGARHTRTVFLAWSASTRDNFKEFRKAAKSFEATAHLADGPESYERREKYSMGHGNYLASRYWTSAGWSIRKIDLDWIARDHEIFSWE